MTATRESLADAWRNRRPLERWMMLAPAAALVVVALELGVVEPLGAASARMRAALPAKIAERDAVQAQAAELRAMPPSSARRTLSRPAIEDALAKSGIDATQATLESAGDDRLRLAIARAPFHALVPLLATLQQQLGVRAVTLRIDRLDAAHARLEATLASG
jgi:type II secretory pathway component PulM